MTIVEQQTIDLLTRIATALEAAGGDEAAKAKFTAANEARAKAEADAAKAKADQDAAAVATAQAKAAKAVADAEAAHKAAQENLAATQKAAATPVGAWG